MQVATVLTACGIETRRLLLVLYVFKLVATVLTACGIETGCDTPFRHSYHRCNSAYRLRY